MTRNLGIRYLWIDALCILQNSTQEWFHEASIMGDIYANSTLTISATNSINSDGGLYYSRTPLSVWPCRIEATWTCFPSKKMVMKTRGWAAEKAMKPLGDRGWAFQEWLLSKRTIHFSKDQVRWQCHCLAASEVYPEGVDSELYGVPTKNLIRLLKESDNPKILWLRIRQEFSKKSLTVASDRLAAFSGIARMVFKVMNWPEENFVAGLSRPELLIELLWLHAYVNILEARTFLCDDAFGPVTGGHLNVRCTLWSVELMYFPRADGDAANRKWKAIFQDAISLTHEWSNASLDNVPHTRSSPPIRRTFYYMPIMSRVQGLEERNCDLVGLLLEKDADHHHQYRRTGMLELFEIEQKTLLASSVGLVNMDSAEARSMDASRLCTIDII
ncbi:uncharacterized protein KY384_002823 [Bacidia gigantensis]|uniref:uncharacterized protein n=1 Tax=Bacidia gigantensis TaxID=2732470 RepID=UPI001D041620|nr:uncharacterized protein KY384_002823 [Bacidia gigantensis]KAG8532945.1 hypothetical protein KY384_002823 [Bacidia gigantensis]